MAKENDLKSKEKMGCKVCAQGGGLPENWSGPP